MTGHGTSVANTPFPLVENNSWRSEDIRKLRNELGVITMTGTARDLLSVVAYITGHLKVKRQRCERALSVNIEHIVTDQLQHHFCAVCLPPSKGVVQSTLAISASDFMSITSFHYRRVVRIPDQIFN
jgi:hypothetical protein